MSITEPRPTRYRPPARLTHEHVTRIHELRRLGLTQVRIAGAVGFSSQTVSRVLRGIQWTSGKPS